MILNPHNYLRPFVNEAAVFAVIYRKLTATGPCFTAEILGFGWRCEPRNSEMTIRLNLLDILL